MLLDGENALTCNMTIQIVLAGLKKGYLILKSFNAKGDKTITFFAVWAVERDALEMVLAQITGIVILSLTGSEHMLNNYWKGGTTYIHSKKAPKLSLLLRPSSKSPRLENVGFCSLSDQFLNLRLCAIRSLFGSKHLQFLLQAFTG